MSNVLKYRESLNLTQEELSIKANISKRTVQRIEAGQKPKGYTLEALSQALDVSKEALLGEEEQTQENSRKENNLINLSSLLLIFIPIANILLPLGIMYRKKAFSPVTRKIVTLQILWTVISPIIALAFIFITKMLPVGNKLVPLVVLLLIFCNGFIIVRNSIEIQKKNKLYIDLKFSLL